MSNWLQKSKNGIGYKVVSFDGINAYSLANKNIIYSLKKGSYAENIFLGTSKEFCIDYYSGLTDDKELLLTYSYNYDDIVSGGGNNSEIYVKKAKLIGYENVV